MMITPMGRCAALNARRARCSREAVGWSVPADETYGMRWTQGHPSCRTHFFHHSRGWWPKTTVNLARWHGTMSAGMKP